MARASTKTKLPLDTWAKIMGINPLHFNGVRLINDQHCSQTLFQHEWQNADHVSREEIARAIAESEAKIEQYLKYHLAPTWDVDEWHEGIRPVNRAALNLNSSDIRGYSQTVRADWGYMISGGIKSMESIDDTVAIVYSDPDGDGYFQVATATVATTVVDKNEICAFYPGHPGDEEWEIRPIEVEIGGGAATIVFRREQAVEEEYLEVMDTEDIQITGTDNSFFLQEIAVWRRYNDPQSQASFLWEPFANGWCGVCNGTGCSSCAYSTQTGCLLIRGDPRDSLVAYHPADWDGDALDFTAQPWVVSRQPDIVRLYYYSGWRNKSNAYVSRMDPDWERVVAYMAAAMLDRPACDCSASTWEHWRQDITLYAGDEDGKPYFREPGTGRFAGVGVSENPFGSRRGEIWAWRKVIPTMRATAVLL